MKRTKKITALLVAAASIISTIPAMAADTQKLQTKDGTIESAIAFKDGKYIYQGYKSDSDNDGVYYSADNKDKLLEDVDNSELNGSYADKYAFAKDGNDEYLVDLTSGQVSDSTPEDNQDTVATKLKSSLKKTDRYGQISSNPILERIEKAADFSDVWYQYTAAPTSSADGNGSTVSGNLYGFADQNGKYIDTSNIANIYTYSSKKGKVVKVGEFSNKLSDVDSDTKLLATLVEKPQLLTQDKNYIYTKITVQIYDENAGAGNITGTTTSAAAVVGADSSKVVTRTYIQKISKAQGDKKDDAYIPKTVETYEVTKGELDSSAANDAFDAISGATDYSVANGKLLVINKTSDNIKVTSINLKKDKVKYKTYKPISLTLSDKVDVYLAEKDDSDDVDIKGSGNAYSIDVDGNVWAVADGKIYEFKNNTMTKVYTCDSSLNSINVYDENNLIAWKENGDIYTTVEKASNDKTVEVTLSTPIKTGWDKLADGSWNFYDLTGAKITSKWINSGGVWYHLKTDGIMATGWLNDNGTWYYLASSGAMKTGWINDNGTWYYLYQNGAMAANTVINGYKLSSSGALI